MVNKAYTLLVEDEDSCPSDRHGSPTCDGKENGCNAVSSSNIDDEKKISKIYSGLTTCVSDKHVHVECKEEVVAHLVEMAEPELSGLRQERHAKTIEIAQKEVLTCIGKLFSQCVSKYPEMRLIKLFFILGICLYERFQRIQQKLREGQQACDLLFYVALQSLKHSFEMAFESKQGISDLEKLCQEFDEEDRKKQEKAQKKREKKKSKKTTSTSSVSATNSSTEKTPKNSENKQEKVSIIKKLENTTCKIKTSNSLNLNQEPMSVLKLASIMDSENLPEEDLENEEIPPQEEIQQYLQEISAQREELRRNLRQRFAQLCVNGL